MAFTLSRYGLQSVTLSYVFSALLVNQIHILIAETDPPPLFALLATFICGSELASIAGDVIRVGELRNSCSEKQHAHPTSKCVD